MFYDDGMVVMCKFVKEGVNMKIYLTEQSYWSHRIKRRNLPGTVGRAGDLIFIEMKKAIFLAIALGFFTACAAHKNTVSNSIARRNNSNVRQNNTAPSNGYTSLSSLQYIDKYKQIAVQEMKSFGIPASITLAQGLYESGAGNSDLARVANNHFGIKAGYSWNGKVYYKDDDNKNDAFRVYQSPEESFRDHSNFLKKKNYASLYTLDITDYRGWARGLKKAGYATNPNYSDIIIGIIEKYNLQQYDTGDYTVNPKPVAAAIAPVAVQPPPPTTASASIPTPAPVTVPDSSAAQAAPVSKNYAVKQGDTLYNISKRFGLSVDDLRALNNLNGNSIYIGQILVVIK